MRVVTGCNSNCCISFGTTLATLSDFCLHLLGILSGYFAYNKRVEIKWSIFLTGLCICMFMYFKGYGTFIGKIETTAVPDFHFADRQGNVLSLRDFSGKYIVADFWHTKCDTCFKKFPEVQALYENYCDNPLVSVIAINVRFKNEPDNAAFEIIGNKGYSFPVYRLDKDNSILRTLNIKAYPTVLIINPEMKIIFRGSIDLASDYILKLTGTL